MQCVDFPVKDFRLKKISAQKREEFTRSTITQSLSKYPHFNWVICHSPYSVTFDGVEGTDYGHYHYELKISFGRTIGSVHLTLFSIYSFLITLLNRYDLYFAKSGTFYRYGDGGFINVRITPSFRPVNQQYDFTIQHSGRIMVTYSVPMIMGRPFTLEHHLNLTSRLLYLFFQVPDLFLQKFQLKFG